MRQASRRQISGGSRLVRGCGSPRREATPRCDQRAAQGRAEQTRTDRDAAMKAGMHREIARSTFAAAKLPSEMVDATGSRRPATRASSVQQHARTAGPWGTSWTTRAVPSESSVEGWPRGVGRCHGATLRDLARDRRECCDVDPALPMVYGTASGRRRLRRRILAGRVVAPRRRLGGSDRVSACRYRRRAGEH